jgi:hypothetical protein
MQQWLQAQLAAAEEQLAQLVQLAQQAAQVQVQELLLMLWQRSRRSAGGPQRGEARLQAQAQAQALALALAQAQAQALALLTAALAP